MWPTLLDMSREDCKRVLRRLELDAYASVISALRAQGYLTKDLKNLLEQLRNVLSISSERHRAEVRRAVNDECFTTIADTLAGPNSASEWLLEGRRIIPTMPQSMPQTAYLSIANSVANAAAANNARLPEPECTAKLEPGIISEATPVPESAALEPPCTSAQQTPASKSNLVVLPSGMSVRVPTAEEDITHADEKKRKRAPVSTDSIVSMSKVAAASVLTKTMAGQNLPPATTIWQFGTNLPNSTCTYSSIKSSTGTISAHPTTVARTASAHPQKIVMVSSSNTAETATYSTYGSHISTGSIRTTTMSTVNLPKQYPGSQTVYTPSTTSRFTSQNVVIPTTSAAGTVSVRPRMKTVAICHPSPVPGAIRQTNVASLSSTSTVPRTVQLKAANLTKAGIKVKGDSGVKIITQSTQLSSRVIPKQYTYSSNSETAYNVETAASTVAVVRTPSTSVVAQSGTRVINVVSSQVPKISTFTSSGNLLAVAPKTLQTTGGTVKVYSPSSGAFGKSSTGQKPSVIVVQKSSRSGQHAQRSTGSGIQERSGASYAIDSGQGKQTVVRVLHTNGRELVQAHPPFTLPQQPNLDQDSNILAELIRAAGIVDPSPAESDLQQQTSDVVQQPEDNMDFNERELVRAAQTASQTPAPGPNQWVQYDVLGNNEPRIMDLPDAGEPMLDVKTLLEMNKDQSITAVSRAPLDVNQYITMEQANTLLSQGLEIIPEVVTEQPSQDAISTSVESVIAAEAPRTQHFAHADQIVIRQGGMETVGELDPVTGMFHQNKNQTSGSGSSGNRQYVIHHTSKFNEGLLTAPTTTVVTKPTTTDHVGDIPMEQHQITTEQVLPHPTNLQPAVSIESVPVSSSPLSKPVNHRSTPKTQQIAALLPSLHSQIVASSAKDAEKSKQSTLQPNIVEPDHVSTKAAATLPSEVSTMSTNEDNVMKEDPKQEGADSAQFSITKSSVSVTVVPMAAELDTHRMQMEDYTSQLLANKEDYSSTKEESSITDGEGDAVARKRKRSSPVDEPVRGGAMWSGWMRSASALLDKVSKFRGSGRLKGELNAADWFNKPVNLEEAPDYLNIVKNPMDFSTIKNKIDGGLYTSFDAFHDDMMLVKTNCFEYNPPEHAARKDCKEVFNFYNEEYNKLMEKWQKSHLVSQHKASRLDK